MSPVAPKIAVSGFSNCTSAAADLATSYLRETALINDSRRSGKTETTYVAMTTYVVDRQSALGRFRTLPWASVARDTVAAFTVAVGLFLLDQPKRRPDVHVPTA
jgi:hypothetical protein